MIAVTGFERVSDVRTSARAAVDWPALVTRLSQHDRRAHKDGPGWAPTVFTEPCTCGGEKCPGASGHRITQNVIEIHALVFDLDKKKNPKFPGTKPDGKPEPRGIPLDEMTAWQCLHRLDDLGLRRIVHTTHSHNPPEQWSLRVVIALSRPVPIVQWEQFWGAAVARIGIHVEPSCKNPDRFWFAPSAPPESEPWSRSYDGAPLDVDAVLEDAQPEQPAPVPARQPRTRAPRRQEFDIYRFVAEMYPSSRPHSMRDGGMRWEIVCPWEGEHSSSSPRDTMISIDGAGKLGFHCLHDHCSDRGWTEFRKFHDPQWVPFAERPADDLARARERRAMRTDSAKQEQQARTLGAEPTISQQLDLRHAGIGEGGGYRCTDLGNARRFADMHADHMRYVHAWDQWLVWDGRRWRRDDNGAHSQAAKQVTAAIYGDAAACMSSAAAAINAGASVGPTYVEALVKWAGDSAKRARVEAMIALARSEQEIAARSSDFDADPFLFNVLNGTIDLRTGELRPHAQADLITKLAPVTYDPEAGSEIWDRFLDEVVPDDKVQAWLQRFLGYCLTGSVREQKFSFWVGKGGNGKNVMADAVCAVMGEYAMVGAPDLLLEKRGETHPTELADLDGKRLVVCSEIEPGRSWAEARIKQITGDKVIKARRMGKDFYEFAAVSKLVVLANTKPKVRGTDDGLWRRMMLVPWDVQIPKERQDKGLLDKLQASELSGVLAWLVNGCCEWHRLALGTADAIDKATAGYRADQDLLGLWIRDRCMLSDGAWSATDALHKDYLEWCKAERIDYPWSRRTFRERLLERNGIADKRSTSGDQRGLTGIRLLEQWEGV